MPSSKQLQIRDAAAAAVIGAVTVDGGVLPNREFTLPTDKTAQIHVNFTKSTPLDTVIYAGHPRDWMTDIELVFLTRKKDGVEATDAADALWTAAYQALMADQSLGGLVSELLPGEAFTNEDEADTSVCRLTWTFTARHRTSNNSLTS